MLEEIANSILTFWFKIGEKLRYLLVGGFNTVFAFGLFCLLQFLFKNHLHYLLILLICHLISVFNSFLTFRFFVFKSTGNFWHEYIKINMVYAGYYLANAFLLYILIDWLKANIFLSQLLCIGILTIITYFAHKHFSFKK